MGKRKVDASQERIREMVRHPGWLDLEEKAKIILTNADHKLHTSSKDGFDYMKGFYEGVKLFHDLIVINPLGIVDLQGIVKLGRKT
jgi:hypothetical protein